MTQAECARKNIITPEMKKIAKDEGLKPEFVRRQVASGRAVILKNSSRRAVKGWSVKGVGQGLSVKVNANLGSSPDRSDVLTEKEKLKAAIRAGADTVMDLSTGGNLREIRKMVLEKSTVPVGTVPIYEAACRALRSSRGIECMESEDMLRSIEDHAKEGVDFITVHCGVTRATAKVLKKQKRIAGIVSRGGAFIYEWMAKRGKENPLYERYGDILDICYRHDVTISLGDGLRPGSIADATDLAQLGELSVLGKLAAKARLKNVQVIIEGPGHVPINQISRNVELQKKTCGNAPFYVLGPLVTDIGAGYDHITCAIGGAIAATCGADFLCYVTPSEHLGLPDAAEVHEGVIATRLAAHAADVARGLEKAVKRDLAMSVARRKFDWAKQEKLSIDPKRFRERLRKSVSESGACTMCGKYCAMKHFNQ